MRGEKPGEDWKEPMTGDRLERPTFDVILGDLSRLRETLEGLAMRMLSAG